MSAVDAPREDAGAASQAETMSGCRDYSTGMRWCRLSSRQQLAVGLLSREDAGARCSGVARCRGVGLLLVNFP